MKFDLWGLVTLDIQKSKIIVAFGNGIRIICPTDRQSVREPGGSGKENVQLELNCYME